MKKQVIILLLILSTLSIAYAIYENCKAEQCSIQAERTELLLNEKIRQLETSLSKTYKELESEKRHAREARKIAENLAMQAEKPSKPPM